ncbi:hypothetical protein COLO4_23849 [Corchorus olitorius]|uniref:Uncharacterized protein n=1 Tax=Corchorus olitorius TaxID=93759 RepID=A0A1R3IEF6_9ROSI|nr:hypothetical protein COLO4_23849 [Corchorus olitorius]
MEFLMRSWAGYDFMAHYGPIELGIGNEMTQFK